MNLLFDLDGTISDPFEGITKSMNDALERLGYEKREGEYLARYIGPSLKLAFAELLNTNDEVQILKAIALFRERYFSVGFQENELYAGVVDLLASLRGKHALYIITSKREDIARRVIKYFQLEGYFEGVFGCDLDLSKGDLIRRVLVDKNLESNEAVMIGDRKFDIEAGRANDLETIGVLWGYGSEEELLSAGADHVMNSMDGLRDLLIAKGE